MYNVSPLSVIGTLDISSLGPNNIWHLVYRKGWLASLKGFFRTVKTLILSPNGQDHPLPPSNGSQLANIKSRFSGKLNLICSWHKIYNAWGFVYLFPNIVKILEFLWVCQSFWLKLEKCLFSAKICEIEFFCDPDGYVFMVKDILYFKGLYIFVSSTY